MSRESTPVQASAKDRIPKPRFSFQLAADKSRVDWESMKPDNREQLRRLFASPEAQRELGTAAPVEGSAPAAASVPTAALMGPLFDAVGLVLVGLAQRSGYTEAQARVLVFSRDEQDVLVPLTSKVIDKYFPNGLGTWQEEIALAVVLGGIGMRKLELLRAPASATRENIEEKAESVTAH